MSLFPVAPSMILNIFALAVACPAIWLLLKTRSRESRQLRELEGLTWLTQFDEPMPVLDTHALRLNRLCYRVGAACLGIALLLSWVSTRL